MSSILSNHEKNSVSNVFAAIPFLFAWRIKTISTIVPRGKSYSLTRNELPYVFAAAKRERKKGGKAGNAGVYLIAKGNACFAELRTALSLRR